MRILKQLKTGHKQLMIDDAKEIMDSKYGVGADVIIGFWDKLKELKRVK